MPASRSNIPARLLIALLLAAMTMGVIGFLGKYMGTNMMLAEVSTMLSTPALTMARLTSGDPSAWSPAFIAWGIGFYWIVWLIILAAVWQTRSSTSRIR
jgi:hypothetical protein